MKKHFLLIFLILTLLASVLPFKASGNVTTQNMTEHSSVIQTDGNQTTPEYGGTLRIGHFPGMAYYNPFFFESIWAGVLPIYNGLLRIDENSEYSPDLARGWHISNDGLNYTFFLFENVTWHDGEEFNASDVEFTFNAVKNHPSVWWSYKNCLAPIVSMEVINRSTILICLNQSFAGSYLYYLDRFPIIPKHLYYETDLQTNPTNYIPVGTGPFEFVEGTPGVNTTLCANEFYFRGRPYLDSVILRSDIPFEDLPDLLLNNTIDVAGSYYEFLDPLRIEEFKQIPGISFFNREDPSIWIIGFNFRNPTLRNPKVRQAINHAINRSRICDEFFLGYARSAVSPIPQGNSYWHNPNVTTYDYNVSMAETLLDQAGYPENESGVRFELDYLVWGIGDLVRNQISQLVEVYLEDVGINVTMIYPSSYEEGLEILNVTHAFDLAGILGWYVSPDPDYLYDFYHSSGVVNFWNYSVLEVDSLLEQSRLTRNQTTRREIFCQIQEILSEESPNAFIYYRLLTTAYNNDFHGFVENNPFIFPVESYSLERVWYEPTLSGQGKSPVKICFINEQGNRTGFFNGSTVQEIPNSTYDEESNVVKIRSPEGNYTVEVTGTGNGTYSLEIVNIALGYKYTEIPLNTIYTNQTRIYYAQVFPDGSLKVWDPLLDIYEDWKIDIRDVAAVAICYGSNKGDPDWNVVADIYEDDKIDIKDVARVAKEFGEVWP